MPQNITTSAKALVEAAEREIETLVDRGRHQAAWPRRYRAGRYPRPARIAARRQGARRVPLPARHAGILDRSGEPLSQAEVRRRTSASCSSAPAACAQPWRRRPRSAWAEAGGPYPRRIGAWKNAGGPVEAPEPPEAEGYDRQRPKPQPGPPVEQPRRWSTPDVWMLGLFSVIGLVGFIATFALIVYRSPDAQVPRALTDVEMRGLTGPRGPAGERGPAGPTGAARPAR